MITPVVRKHNYLKFVATLLLFFTSAAGAATAQTPTPTATPKSEEVLRLEEEKAQAELRKAIAEANKAELEAKFPKPTSSPLAGTTTISDGAVIESQIVAYSAMARAANRLVRGINQNTIHKGVGLKVAKLAVFNEEDVRLLLSYKTSRNQLETMRRSYCMLLAKSQTTKEQCPEGHRRAGSDPAVESLSPIGPALSVARSLFGSFVDLTSFLRTNVEIKGQTFDIDEAPFVAEVLRAARRTDGSGLPSYATFYYPRMYPPDAGPDRTYKILGTLDTVQALRNTAGRLIAGLEKNAEDIAKAKTRVETLKAAVNQLKPAVDAARAKRDAAFKAYCPGVSPEERDDSLGVGVSLRNHCPDLAAEKREHIFGLVNEVKRLDTELTEAKAALDATEKTQKALEAERAKLWEAFNAVRGGGENATALAVADIAGQLKSRNHQFDKFIEALVQAGAGGGSNALTSLIKAEDLQDALSVADPQLGMSYWLQLKVLKAGGNNRIKTNLLWDIFTGGNRVSHSGGVVVEYILFNTSGQAVASDTIAEYTNYIKSDRVRKLPSAQLDDGNN